jgi:MFS family permease
MYVSLVLASITLFNVFVNIVPYAEERGVRKVRAALLISVLGGCSVFGRIALGVVAARLTALRTFTACVGVMGLSQLLWLLAGGRMSVLVVFVGIFGVAYGGLIALGPLTLVELFGAQQLGGLAGVNYTASGIAALAGPTVCSWLVDRTESYQASSLLGLVCGSAGCLMLVKLCLAKPTTKL